MATNKTRRAVGVYEALERALESVAGLLERQAAPYELTLKQVRVLETLLHQGPADQATLCEKLRCPHSTMNRVVVFLEKRGLVTGREDEKDRRKRAVRLTMEGEKLIAKIYPLHVKLIRAQVSALNQREQETLQRLSEKLAAGDVRTFVLEMTGPDVEDGFAFGGQSI